MQSTLRMEYERLRGEDRIPAVLVGKATLVKKALTAKDLCARVTPRRCGFRIQNACRILTILLGAAKPSDGALCFYDWHKTDFKS